MINPKVGQIWKFIEFKNPRFDDLKFIIVAQEIGNKFSNGGFTQELGWRIKTMIGEEYWLTDRHFSRDAILLEDQN